MKVKAKGRKISLKMTESRDTLSRAVYLNEFFFTLKKKENMAAVKVTERRQLAFTDPLASIGRFRLQKSQHLFFLYFAQFSLLGLSAALPNHTNRFIWHRPNIRTNGRTCGQNFGLTLKFTAACRRLIFRRKDGSSSSANFAIF